MHIFRLGSDLNLVCIGYLAVRIPDHFELQSGYPEFQQSERYVARAAARSSNGAYLAVANEDGVHVLDAQTRSKVRHFVCSTAEFLDKLQLHCV